LWTFSLPVWFGELFTLPLELLCGRRNTFHLSQSSSRNKNSHNNKSKLFQAMSSGSQPTQIPRVNTSSTTNRDRAHSQSDDLSPMSRYTGELDQRIEYSPSSNTFYNSISLPEKDEEEAQHETPSRKRRGSDLRRTLFHQQNTEKVSLIHSTNIHDGDDAEEEAEEELTVTQKMIHWHMLGIGAIAVIVIGAMLVFSLFMSRRRVSGMCVSIIPMYILSNI
jgi:hypothetical protein